MVSAIVGAGGLIPTLSAVKAGKAVALANKESLVMAGKILMEEAERNHARILPVDSEHSAIFQELLGHQWEDIHRLILTASGGPFLNLPMARLHEVTVREALSHPHWEMGKKITIDSASLMNKGLEVIEDHWLFNIPVDKIVVQIHPQSVVHSMVEYRWFHRCPDGDRRYEDPDRLCPPFPRRLNLNLPPLDLPLTGGLTFFEPDTERFPCLSLAYQSIEVGETMPAILNAANEIAVNAFLEGSIKFTQVPLLLQQVMGEHQVKEVHTIEDVLRADHWARERARAFLIERSPRTYMDDLSCPLLVIQGKNDPRVVEEESSDLVKNLRTKGKQVELLVFQNEGHDVLKYDNRVACYNTITEFFKEHLQP